MRGTIRCRGTPLFLNGALPGFWENTGLILPMNMEGCAIASHWPQGTSFDWDGASYSEPLVHSQAHFGCEVAEAIFAQGLKVVYLHDAYDFCQWARAITRYNGQNAPCADNVRSPTDASLEQISCDAFGAGTQTLGECLRVFKKGGWVLCNTVSSAMSFMGPACGVLGVGCVGVGGWGGAAILWLRVSVPLLTISAPVASSAGRLHEQSFPDYEGWSGDDVGM